MESQVLFELDKRVEQTFKTKNHSSIILESGKVLYLNEFGQPLIEFEIEGLIQDYRGEYHISIKEFDYSNKLGNPDV